MGYFTADIQKSEMSPRENVLRILHGEQPEVYHDPRIGAIGLDDPISKLDSMPADGKEHKDSFGVTCVWPVGAPGKHPHITEANKVLKDVTKWREQVEFPNVKHLDWSHAEEQAKKADRSWDLVQFRSSTGLFERMHFLMGMEDAFCNYLEEPEACFELLTAIKDYKIECIKEAAYHCKPDYIFFQDDWGSKTALFLPPDTWREMIKPHYFDIAKTIHECGMLYMHHSDCFCEPIAEDMVELGFEWWQGVIPQNDIVAIQERTNHQLAMIGGVDGPAIDGDGVSDEAIIAEVHRCIDTYCPGGKFYPCAPARLMWDHNNNLVVEEIERYGRQWALEHPVG